MAVLEVVDQVAERHPGPDENGRTAEDFRITVDDSGMLTHVLPRYTSIEPLSPLSAYLLQEACGPTMCCASRGPSRPRRVKGLGEPCTVPSFTSTDFARVTSVAINAGRRPVRARRNAVGR